VAWVGDGEVTQATRGAAPAGRSTRAAPALPRLRAVDQDDRPPMSTGCRWVREDVRQVDLTTRTPGSAARARLGELAQVGLYP
jgi:hypothetical protein